jgi:hypothetical protein
MIKREIFPYLPLALRESVTTSQLAKTASFFIKSRLQKKKYKFKYLLKKRETPLLFLTDQILKRTTK